ncbi:MAG TPA: DUF6152 family protein [Gammaproteobacteria bacterium]
MTTISPKIINTFSSRLALVAAAAGLAAALPAAAHHSQSEFDFKSSVTVEGKVTELSWKSPHARLYVDVVNENGEVENWNFELPSPTTLMRRGWTRKSLQPGDTVTVTAAPAKNFPTIAYARSIRNANGEPMFTGVTEVVEPEPVSDDSSGSAP